MNTILYIVTILMLILSYRRDAGRTKKALQKSWNAFSAILPQFLVVILLVGVMLTLMDADTILAILGSDSRWFGVLLAAVVGAVTLIPGFVAFPTAAMLLQGGAGYMQIAAFISTLMMVGIMTLPVEISYFGKRLALYRNLMAFAFSFLVAYVIGLVEALV
ncbi:MAG: permease [Spirochaetia bacterium]|nr:permease [Spirochaetia bacterium]